MSEEVIVEEKPIVESNPFATSWSTTPKEIMPEIKEVKAPEAEVKKEEPIETKKEEEKPEVKEVPENKPPVTEIKTELPKFANEVSEKVYNLFLAGEADKALDIYSEQKRLREVDKLPPADIIKLNLQYQNKDFTPSEINDLFEETYSLPEKPIKGEFEDEEEFKFKDEKYKAALERVENRIKRDAKPASAELSKLAAEIVLPNIQKPETLVIEPTQEELGAQKLNAEKFLKALDDNLQAVKGYTVTYKDEEVEIPVAYNLTKDEKAKIQPLIALSNSNAGEFFQKIGWIDDKGNINTTKMAEDLPFILDKESVLQKMVTETGNQRYAAAKKSIKNVDYSGGKTAGGDLGATPEQLEKQWVAGFFSK